jgi:hypothetical protein
MPSAAENHTSPASPGASQLFTVDDTIENEGLSTYLYQLMLYALASISVLAFIVFMMWYLDNAMISILLFGMLVLSTDILQKLFGRRLFREWRRSRVLADEEMRLMDQGETLVEIQNGYEAFDVDERDGDAWG